MFNFSLGIKQANLFAQYGKIITISGLDNFAKVSATASADATPVINMGIQFISRKAERSLPPPAISFLPAPPEKDTTALSARKKTMVLTCYSRHLTVCLRKTGLPDSDRFALRYNGSYLFQNRILEENPECFDITINRRQPAVLQLEITSEGKVHPNPVVLSVKQNNKEEPREFHLRVEAGKGEEIKFVFRRKR